MLHSQKAESSEGNGSQHGARCCCPLQKKATTSANMCPPCAGDVWGLTLLVRTGNAAFGTGVLARRKRRTRQCPGAGGQQRGQDDAVRELPDEATIRRPLGLPFTPPEQCQGGLL